MSGGPGPILVINPNSNQAVTDGLDTALDPFRSQGAPEIECVTLAEGPFGIESQADMEAVVLPLRDLVVERADVGLGRGGHALKLLFRCEAGQRSGGLVWSRPLGRLSVQLACPRGQPPA